ncbi:hypothetical protein B0T19DRAFT_414312 [Cercophora scortea]|uniref:Secreted protein n=1 Tax=Cercophora scortea TaxID=314031 RepID=A0AAE0IWR0_9PEZI|nr:hypothetical protein B0T19DRAFT_414312 [Cercophora scortea]
MFLFCFVLFIFHNSLVGDAAVAGMRRFCTNLKDGWMDACMQSVFGAVQLKNEEEEEGFKLWALWEGRTRYFGCSEQSSHPISLPSATFTFRAAGDMSLFCLVPPRCLLQ